MSMARIPIGPKPWDLPSMGNVRLRAVRRCHCVDGGGSVNFGRRWRCAANPEKSAAAKIFFSKVPKQISFYSQNLLMTFFHLGTCLIAVSCIVFFILLR